MVTYIYRYLSEMKTIQLIGEHNVRPAGAIHTGASKSISNRMLLMRRLYSPDTELHNLSESEDTQWLQKGLTSGETEIYAGDGGTTARFLAVYLATRPGEHILRGSARMNERPMAKLFDALRQLGAEISYLEKEGFLPVSIKGCKPEPGSTVHFENPESGQFISALCLVAPSVGMTISYSGAVTESYIQLTLALLAECYVQAEAWHDPETERSVIEIHRSTPVLPAEYVVENDWSSAAFWMEWMLQAPMGMELYLDKLLPDSIQPDAYAMHYFEMLGLSFRETDNGIMVKKAARPDGSEFHFDLEYNPDLFPALACSVAALGLNASFAGLHSLVYKESNRLQSVAEGLAKLGVDAGYDPEESEFFIRAGKLRPTDEAIDTFSDHRIAMAFSALVPSLGKITINDPGVVKKSYPEWWAHVQTYVKDIQLIEK